MRFILIATPVLILLLGCSGKYVRVGGMMCPEGYNQDQVNRDMQECRFYGEAEDEAAAKASYPKKVDVECVKCLEEKGYNIIQ